MKLRIKDMIALALFLIVLSLTGAANASETGTGAIKVTKEIKEKIQAYLVKTAKENSAIYEISLHAMLERGDTVRIACTNVKKLGTPSDPEDVEAIIANQVIFIHEGEVYDITVPLADKQGHPCAVTGIKVEHKGKTSQDEAKEIAIKLAKKIEKMVQSTQ